MPIEKKDAIKGGKFLIILIIAFIAISLGMQFSGAAQGMQSVIANNVSSIFNSFGYQTTLEENIISFPNYDIRISELCTGLLELIILISAIIASIIVSLKKRLLGVMGAIAFVYVINLLRIIISINIILNGNLQAAEFAHDLLFRISLIVVIVGFYGIWFWFATNQKK